MFVRESSMVFKDTSLSNFTTWLTRVESEQLSPESDGWEIHFNCNWVPDICGPEINSSMLDKNTRILQYWWAAGGGGRWSPVAARAAAASRPGPAVRALSDLESTGSPAELHISVGSWSQLLLLFFVEGNSKVWVMPMVDGHGLYVNLLLLFGLWKYWRRLWFKLNPMLWKPKLVASLPAKSRRKSESYIVNILYWLWSPGLPVGW